MSDKLSELKKQLANSGDKHLVELLNQLDDTQLELLIPENVSKENNNN